MLCAAVTVGFVDDSVVEVKEGETVTVCGEMDVAPDLLQREIFLEGHTCPETADGKELSLLCETNLLA